MGKAQMRLKGEPVGLAELKEERRAVRRGKRIQRGTGVSPDEVLSEPDEQERLTGYIKSKFLNTIINRSTAKEAVWSMAEEPRRGSPETLGYLIEEASDRGRENYAIFLEDKHKKANLNRIEKASLRLHSGKKRSGMKISSDIYLIRIKYKQTDYAQARDFRTGQIIKTEDAVEIMRR